MCRRLNLECRAVLHDEVERRLHLAVRRQAVEDIADKILGEHTDVGVLVCQIPKRPAIEAEHTQGFAKCCDAGHFVFYCAFGATT